MIQRLIILSSSGCSGEWNSTWGIPAWYLLLLLYIWTGQNSTWDVMAHWFMFLSLIVKIIPSYQQHSLYLGTILGIFRPKSFCTVRCRSSAGIFITLFICCCWFPIIFTMAFIVFACPADIFWIICSMIPVLSKPWAGVCIWWDALPVSMFSDIMRNFPSTALLF